MAGKSELTQRDTDANQLGDLYLETSQQGDESIDDIGRHSPSTYASFTAQLGKRLVNIALPLLTFVGLVIIWEVAVIVFHVPNYVVPKPTQIPRALSSHWSSIISATGSTLEESLFGFVVAALAAIPLALAITTVKVLEKTLYPLLIVIQTIPKIALGPLFVIWFGFGLMPKIALVFLLTFFPILVASATGFKALDIKLVYLMRSMGASRSQIVTKLRIPEALPHIFGGLEVGIVMSTTAALVAEFIGSNSGLGYLLLQSQGQLETTLVFAIIVIISLMGMVFAGALLAVKWLLMPWSRL